MPLGASLAPAENLRSPGRREPIRSGSGPWSALGAYVSHASGQRRAAAPWSTLSRFAARGRLGASSSSVHVAGTRGGPGGRPRLVLVGRGKRAAPRGAGCRLRCPCARPCTPLTTRPPCRSAPQLQLAGSGYYELQAGQLSLLQLVGLRQAAAPTFGYGSDGIHALPIRSKVGCDKVTEEVTARELDLQQQRRCALAAAGGSPQGGYVAACLAVKDQHRDLAEWLDWHASLGVSRFYLMDAGSDPPLDELLVPYVQVPRGADKGEAGAACSGTAARALCCCPRCCRCRRALLLAPPTPRPALPCPALAPQAGLVVHRMMGNASETSADLGNTTCRSFAPRFMQLLAYSTCLRDYGAQHQWMGALAGARGLQAAGILLWSWATAAAVLRAARSPPTPVWRPPPTPAVLLSPLPAACCSLHRRR